MKHDVDFFISFFEAIPEDQWTSGQYHIMGRSCAVGHCSKHELITPLYKLLVEHLGTGVVPINDGFDFRYKQGSPRARILHALHDIKRKLNPPAAAPKVQHECCHCWVMDVCLYCCASKPAVQQPESVIA